MEAVLLRYSSSDQSFSPYKQSPLMRNSKNGRSNRSFNILNSPLNLLRDGRLQPAPSPSPLPFLSQSFPPQYQPPLLPLPTNSKPLNNNNINRLRAYNHAFQNSRKGGKTSGIRDQQAVRPKKSKQSTNKEYYHRNSYKSSILSSSECLMISSVDRLGPEPDDLPKDVSKVISSSESYGTEEGSDGFSGSAAFSISPPPSSLPLPTFFLRTKLSCNAEAAEIDTGATDSLRRLLRLL